MKPSLDGVRLKLRSADENLAFLYGQLGLFMRTEAGPIVGEHDRETGDYIFRVSGGAPPLDWGLLVGQYAHLLRSSLDNLLWQVIELRGATPKPGLTQFPIYEDEAKFNGKANPRRPSAFTLTEGVLPEDFAFIEAVQPYQDRRHPNLATKREENRPALSDLYAAWHPLAVLAYINNIDKHRFIHTGYAAVAPLLPGRMGEPVPTFINSGRLALYLPVGQGLQAIGLSMPVCTDGSVLGDDGMNFKTNDDPTEIARAFRIKVRPGAEPKMEMQPPPALEISFCDRKRPVSIYDLFDIRTAVHQVVDWFGPDFEP